MANVIEGYRLASSSNLPCVDLLMLGRFIASNKNTFFSAQYQNDAQSSASYGDEAVTNVQLKREEKLCTVKCILCPEEIPGNAKSFAVTMVIDEENESVTSIQCHDCVRSMGTCKHALAFLMWVHRKSEEPTSPTKSFYWRESNRTVIKKGIKRKHIDDNDIESATMQQLILKINAKCCDTFLEKITLTDSLIKKIEQKTRGQHYNNLWHKLRFGRITASVAFQVSEWEICQDIESILASIMGKNIPDNYAMKRGRDLKDTVRETVCNELGKKFKKCGLFISKQYPVIAGSPDGICEDSIISIKCPMSERSSRNFLKNGTPTDKYYTQMQILMYLTGKKKCYFCVAHSEYEQNKKVKIVPVDYDESSTLGLLVELVEFWRTNVYDLLS